MRLSDGARCWQCFSLATTYIFDCDRGCVCVILPMDLDLYPINDGEMRGAVYIYYTLIFLSFFFLSLFDIQAFRVIFFAYCFYSLCLILTLCAILLNV